MIALVVLTAFYRILCGLNVTENLGPIISTTLYMFRDVATFIVIWILVVVAFTLSSYACFGDLEYFTDLN